MDDFDVVARGVMQPAKGPLGRALRGLRRDLFISQEQLAKIGNTTQTTISRLERGGNSWNLFCHLVETVGGRPVVTVEAIPGVGQLWDAQHDADRWTW